MINYNNYELIGIGDFSHGDENIWKYRLDFIKNIIKNTNKNIVIFNEDSKEHSDNIMNTNKKLSYYRSYGLFQNKYPYGPLSKYANRVYHSPIYLDLIKYIRKNKKKIKIIGIDPDKIERDKYMATIILNNLNKNNVNLLFAHNSHIDNRKITQLYETKWHNEKYKCGYYLKKKLGNKYCIILSTGYKGKIRFDCNCSDKYCTVRTPYEKPQFENFEIKEYAKYQSRAKRSWPERSSVCKNELYEHFEDKIAEFSACSFPHNKPFMTTTKTYNYVLFFTNVKPLQLQ